MKTSNILIIALIGQSAIFIFLLTQFTLMHTLQQIITVGIYPILLYLLIDQIFMFRRKEMLAQ